MPKYRLQLTDILAVLNATINKYRQLLVVFADCKHFLRVVRLLKEPAKCLTNNYVCNKPQQKSVLVPTYIIRLVANFCLSVRQYHKQQSMDF